MSINNLSNIFKNSKQQEALNLLRINNLGVVFPTGSGKSRIAIKYISALKSIKLESKVLILIAEIAHRDNWKREFIKEYGEEKGGKLFRGCTTECYASLKKYEGSEWDFIVMDEAHHIGSEERMRVINTIKSKKILLLSATLKSGLIYELERHFGKIEVMKMGIDEAIEKKILPKPEFYLLPLELNREVRSEEIVISRGRGRRVRINDDYENRWKYLGNEGKMRYPSLELHLRCTEAQKNEYYNERVEYLKRRYNETGSGKQIWFLAALDRKRFLSNLKTSYIKKICNRIKDRRFICFCGSIKQAEEIGKGIEGSEVIHSEKHKCLEGVQRFNEGKSNSIFCVGMLTEGMNLVNVENGIIGQLDGEDRLFIQKTGKL